MNRARLGSSLAATLVAAIALLGLAAPAQADFGIAAFDGIVTKANGEADNQAGSHPFAIRTEIAFNTHPDPNFFGLPVVDGNPKNIRVDLPPGYVGNPTVTPSLCTEDQITVKPNLTLCPLDSQVGIATVELATATQVAPIYNMVAPDGVPAQFAMNVGGVVIHYNARLRSNGDYGLTIDAENLSQFLSINSTQVDFWGVPADSSHDEQRGECIVNGGPCPLQSAPRLPFLSNPSACSGPLTTRLETDSWQEPGNVHEASFVTHDTLGDPIGIEDCENVPFDPQVRIEATSRAAASPTGLEVEIAVPQSLNPDGRASAALRDAKVVLPAGMAISPPSADGLAGCTDAQFGKGTDAPMSCPQSSKIGSVYAESPLQAEPLTGGVYVGSQNSGDPESGEMYRMFIQLANPARGLDIRLAGKIRANRQTGQLETVFTDNPQLPVSLLSLRLKGGARAPLVNPPSCGTYSARTELTPWSSPAALASTSAIAIDQGCGNEGRFAPGLEAGTTSPVAGKHSPLRVRITRGQGEQNISSLDVTLPEGVLAKLKGVPLCDEAAAAAGTCAAASQIGSATVGAGEGASPLYVPQPGKPTPGVYLAGPYQGAPYSLVVNVPAQAGPFDLGTVAVRNALQVDPVTTQVTAKSDPLPQILGGIPIAYRDIRIDVDRQDFTINPTSCARSSVAATFVSARGASASASDRFQVANCAALGFAPQLNLRLKGRTNRGSYQQLRAELKAKAGQANIGRAAVTMPRSIFLAQEHIKTVCTRDQWAQDACPKASVYGRARAFTPLLDQPLEGPVYLRANGGARELPDLVADLEGQIDVELVGFIDSKDGGIRTRFQGVPDAPVSKFVLNMQGGKKSLLTSSKNLCKSANRASVRLNGQNGKTHDFNPALKVSCGKKR